MTTRLLLAVMLVTHSGAPSSRGITAQGGVRQHGEAYHSALRYPSGVSSLRLDRFTQPAPTIDPTWTYTTPLRWKHAPRGIDESWASVQVVVLYPEGEYLEIRGHLIKYDKNTSVNFSAGDGQLYRAGTWERTDDQVIRIHSRDTWKDDHILNMVHCDANHQNCVTVEQHPIPGPVTVDTCGLEGRSPTYLAKRIHCHQMILQPARLNLDLLELQRMATVVS